MARPTREQLSKLSFSELKGVLDDVQSLIKEAEVTARQEAKQDLMNRARELGFDLSELFSTSIAPASKGKGRGNTGNAPAKYRHPENPELTWTGRGRKPNWYASYVEEHGEEKAAADLSI